MNILIIYSTNSGSTYAAVTQVADVLNEKYTVTIKEALDIKPDELLATDAVILASPSWDYEDKEGQPHENMMTLLNTMKGKQILKPFAILGLGDKSYTNFCGAVTLLEGFVKNCGGTLLIDSLKVDQYYTNHDAAQQVTDWSHLLLQKLQS